MTFLRLIFLCGISIYLFIPVISFASGDCYFKAINNLLSEKPSASLTHRHALNEASPELSKLSREIEQDSEELTKVLRATNSPQKNPGKFKIIANPKKALAARILMIREATDSIDIVYYIFKDTDSSRMLLAELKKALRRGVNVRLMVDGSGSVIANLSNFSEIQTLMKVRGGLRADGLRATFEPVVINPLVNIRAGTKKWTEIISRLITGKEPPADYFSFFQRSHDKILLIDRDIPERSLALIGGRNISNDYFGIGKASKDTYNDLDILMRGVTQSKKVNGSIILKNAIADHFDNLFNFAANKRFNDFFLKIGRSKAASNLNKIRNNHKFFVGASKGELTPIITEMKKTNFLSSNFDQGEISILNEFENIKRRNPFSQKDRLYSANPNSIIRTMWQQFTLAKKEIMIGSPYLYLTDREINQLVNWLKADCNRKLKIITNSSATSDNIPAQAMMEHFVMPKLISNLKKAEIPSEQFEIYAYGNLDHKILGGQDTQGKLHGKFWMVDGSIIGVGTSNFDPFSRLANSEIMANVFPKVGKNSTIDINTFYTVLINKSTLWGSPEFNALKAHPALKNRIRAQFICAKIMDKLKVLPQNDY